MEWFGKAKIGFHSSPDPAVIIRKNGTHCTHLDLCKSVTPKTCNLNPLLFNGHMQTIWTSVTSEDLPLFFKREVFSNQEPAYRGTFAADFVSREEVDDSDPFLPPGTAYYKIGEFDKNASKDTKPMLIVLHGLVGGTEEVYLRHVIYPLVKNGKWDACILNARGCGMSSVTSPMIFNARATWDMRVLVQRLQDMYPNRPLFAIGYSLGANILVNYISEEGSACPLTAAVTCSNPWNLEVSDLAMQRSWLGSELYSRNMASSAKRIFEQNFDQLTQNSRVVIDEVRKARYLHEFNRELQVPNMHYPTQRAYYRDASCVDALLGVQIPLFAINAEDDPVSVKQALPYEEMRVNPYTVMCTTSLGGHLGWFQSNGTRWFIEPITKYLNAMADELSYGSQIKVDAGAPYQGGELLTRKTKWNFFNPLRRRMVGVYG